MADNVIRVNVTTVAPKNVTISGSNEQNYINATGDASVYNAKVAREWAIGEGKVQNIDYSSKHYAGVSKQNAELSGENLNNVQALTREFIELAESSTTELVDTITEAKTGAVTEINNTKTIAEESLVAKNLEILTGLESAQADKLQELENKGNEVIADVTNISNNSIAKIENTSNNAVNTVNSSLEEYTEITEQLKAESGENARIAKEQAEIATTKANAAAASALVTTEQAAIATNQAESARLDAIEATEQASNALASSESAKTSENNAKASESNALASELSANEYKLRCEEIFQRIGTVIKIKGRVNNYDDLPTQNNIDGDAYLVGADGLDAYPEYYWFVDHWEYLGTSGTSLLWGSISGTLANQTDLQNALNGKLSITGTADKALKDSNGLQINTNYMRKTIGDAWIPATPTAPTALAMVGKQACGNGNIAGGNLVALHKNTLFRCYERGSTITCNYEDKVANLGKTMCDGSFSGHYTQINPSTSFTSKPFVWQVTSPTQYEVSDVCRLHIYSHRLSDSLNVTGFKIEAYIQDTLTNSKKWVTTYEYSGASKNIAQTGFGLYKTGYSSTSYYSIFGIRLTISGSPDTVFRMSQVQIVASRGTETLADSLQCVSNAGGKVWGNLEVTGQITVPTKATGTNNTTVATTAFVNNSIIDKAYTKAELDAILAKRGDVHNMFDTVLKDHVLTYEESKGLALQGTYVYKDAVAGERYGYSTFYEKCVEEFQNASNTKQWLKSNVTVVGSLTDNQGVLSGFAANNYAQIPMPNLSNASAWEMVFKINPSAIPTTSTNIFASSSSNQALTMEVITGGKIGFSIGKGSAWEITADKNCGSTVLTVGVDYWVKLEFTGSTYVLSLSRDGKTYTTEVTYASTTKIPYSSTYNFNLGINRAGESDSYKFLGSIDLNDCYINIDGVRTWTGATTVVKNSNKHLFYDINDKSIIDDYYTLTGRAWFYGVDTENERIFLPRNSKYFRIGDESTVGTNQDAGLPNITAQFRTIAGKTPTGATYTVSSGKVDNVYDEATGPGLTVGLDASRSSALYGKTTDTVEVDSVNMLLYICVGNTESEEAITDVIDVTTTENDTLPLLHHIPADELLEHPSWLRSAGQWNDGNVYTTAYNYLVNEYMYGTEHTDTLTTPDGTAYTVTYKTIKGKKVVDVANVSQVDAVYSAIGSAWYYVINQDDMTFRLPMSHNSECYTADPTRVGLDVSAGLPNITGQTQTLKGVDYSAAAWSGALYGTSVAAQAYSTSNANCAVIHLDASRSNPIYGNSDTVTPPHTEFYLYFKVANAVQNLELLNAGEVLEAVNNVVPNNRTVWDGQWVYKELQVTETLAIGSYTFDLSDYLPDDGFTYEVWCTAYISRSDSSGTNSQVHVYDIDDTGTLHSVAEMHADGANWQQGSGSCLLTVGKSRSVGFSIASVKLSASTLNFQKYRRIGTNV